MKSFILVGAFVCAATGAFAQSKPVSTIRPLTIGDTVPDIEFNNLINYHSTKAKLSDFKGKLVILDFWATWCGACLKQLPEIDSLQKIFRKEVQFVLVNSKNTTDGRKKVRDFFENRRNKDGQKYVMPSEAEDTLMSLLFPHLLIPHYVWISPYGKVMAITSPDEVTGYNIQHALDEENISLAFKKDIPIEKPLFLDKDVEVDSIVQYSILLKGKIDGLPGGNNFRKSGIVTRGRAITNFPILTIYKIAAGNLFKEFNEKRMMIEVRDSSRLICNSKTETGRIAWNKENLYSYDLIVPLSKAASLYSYMLEDLNRYSPFYGRLEKRKMKCYALVRTGDEDKMGTKGGSFESELFTLKKLYLRNAPVSNLIAGLNGIKDLELPVIDETNYTGNIDIISGTDFKNMASTRKELNKYGLNLIKTERDLDMFVISDKK